MKELNKKLCLLLLIFTLIIPSGFVNAEEEENNGGNNPPTSEETPSPTPSPSPSSSPSPSPSTTPSTSSEENTPAKSDDATLKSLVVNKESILKSGKSEYEITVASDVEKVEISAEANGKAKIDNSKSNLGSNDLKVGTNTFKIVVIPESEKTDKIKTYQIKVIRATADLSLTKLNIQGLKLNEVFDPDKTEYTADVTYNVTSVTIQNGHPTGTTVAVSGNNNLKVGKNTVTVTVKNASGESKIYTIIVTRGSEDELNSVDSYDSEILSEVTSTENSVVDVNIQDDDSSSSFSLRSIIIVTSSVLLLLIASLGIYFYVRSGDSDKRKQKKIAKLKKKQAKIEEQLTGLMPIITEEQEEEYLKNKETDEEDDEEVVEDIEESEEEYDDNDDSDFEDTIEINSDKISKKSFEYEEFTNYDDDDDEEENEVVTRRRRVDRSILDDELDDLFEDGDE